MLGLAACLVVMGIVLWLLSRPTRDERMASRYLERWANEDKEKLHGKH